MALRKTKDIVRIRSTGGNPIDVQLQASNKCNCSGCFNKRGKSTFSAKSKTKWRASSEISSRGNALQILRESSYFKNQHVLLCDDHWKMSLQPYIADATVESAINNPSTTDINRKVTSPSRNSKTWAVLVPITAKGRKRKCSWGCNDASTGKHCEGRKRSPTGCTWVIHMLSIHSNREYLGGLSMQSIPTDWRF